MRKFWRLSGSVAVIALVLCGGCASSSSSSAASKEATRKLPPPPPDSPMAKIKPGMGMKEVSDILGPPTDTETYMTGKTFIPFYYGGDTHRITQHYKGLGKITFAPDSRFSGDYRVMEEDAVEYDPKESGYK